jgi:chloramphenicol O-acetyltransferase type A
MDTEKCFHPIDMKTWPMAETFYYYTQIAPTTYTVNVNMDITGLRKTLKREGYKFFPAYLYLMTRAVCKQPELRVGARNGVVGYWDKLTPTYPQFHDDDKTTSLLWTEYDESFQSFNKSYSEDAERYGGSHGILSSKGIPLPNAYIVSCIPWFSFNSFSLHNHGIKDYYVPSFEAGGFSESDGKIKMPLSITAHHAVTEGYHIKVFLEHLQYDMDHVSEWLEE